ncbi:MAG: UDP-N-acetylmuramoyl-tripeptide--D-alanyl-D-alanine ligase [Cetobacterium sp.]
MKTFNEVLKNYFKELKVTISEDIYIENIEMDSKKVREKSLFIAINNGNNYIEEALSKGAEIIICDREVPEMKNIRVVKVNNSIEFLQELAKRYRKNMNINVIAITGSEGKTTTKDFIHGVLSKKYKTKKTIGNHNNHIGLPFTILQLKDSDEIAVLEMGMSNLGEIDLLSRIARPNYAVITNIGDSHLEFLKNRDNVFKAKTELLKYVEADKVLLFGDDPYFKNVKGIKIGFHKENEYLIKEREETFEGLYFDLNEKPYFIPLNGSYNAVNSSFAIVLGEIFHMSYSEIKESLEKIKITAMRFEKIEKNDVLYINDAYNASPVSMKMALKAFSTLPLKQKKVVVLGDALELGEKEIEYHKDILEEALKYDFYRIFIYGERMKKALDMLENSKILHCKEKSEIKDEILKLSNIAVLLKGSRGMKLEEIIM